MMLSTSYKSEYCTETRTQSCSFPPRECPSHHWEIIWETWRTNFCQTTISWNLPPEVQKTTGTRPTKVKRTVKSEASHSIVWGREKQRAGRLDFPTGVWRSAHHRRAHTIQNREEHPRIPIVHHGPTKKNTSWPTTSAWWILTPSKPSRMGMSGGRKRTHTWLNCSLLSKSYSDGHLASSHLFLKKKKKKRM